MKLITLEDTRFFHCNIKTLNLIPNVIANQRSAEAGCDEAVFHRGERVTECGHSNVHILKNGVFHTAPADNLILPGITRAHVIGVCRRLGIPVDETPFTLSGLFNADEVIVTSAGTLCTPASHIDGKPVGGKAADLLNRIRLQAVEDFEKETNAKLPCALK
jgi:D-alanine transaminase